MKNELYINVAEKIGNPSALTQEDGNIIYSEIARAIKQNTRIILDFEQIESMISPFLNNAIGQLYGQFTSQQISDYLTIKNFPNEKTATLNIVISNAKKYYSNKERFDSTVKEVFNSWAPKIFMFLSLPNSKNLSWIQMYLLSFCIHLFQEKIQSDMKNYTNLY